MFVVISFFLYAEAVITYAEIEPGEISKQLTADLKNNGVAELIAIRQCTPPAGFERVEIFENPKTNRPIFTSEWKEVEDGLLLSSSGDIEIEKLGSRVLVKYIWRRQGMGTGGGHALTHITYYGYVEGRFRPVFEYTASESGWNKGRFGQTGYSDETLSTLSFKETNGVANIFVQVNQTKIREKDKNISLATTNVTQKTLHYKWNNSRGFVPAEETTGTSNEK